MAGMYTHEGDDKGGTALPPDHWIHKAMAKEKARVGAKKASKAAAAVKSAAAGMPAEEGAPC